ncbi:PepSY-like domain-containing protein [Flexithrix dorotheae]|uniref:PepSY-like domain-containing protein n=1 Tax=Flexithrix dorotheae TaxID=70993 RepID=UPI00037043CA|nr:PepSY-like domain-containing protein [Flexithrix dorotheae]
MNPKIIASAFIFFLICTFSCAPKTEKAEVVIPEEIKQKISTTIGTEAPEIKIKNYYAVEVGDGPGEKEYLFNDEGNLIYSKIELETREVPEYIKTTVEEKFKDFTIDELEVIESDYGTFYELEIKKGEEELELTFDLDGNLLRSVED